MNIDWKEVSFVVGIAAVLLILLGLPISCAMYELSNTNYVVRAGDNTYYAKSLEYEEDHVRIVDVYGRKTLITKPFTVTE